MNYIGEEGTTSGLSAECISHRIFEFSVTKKDFFLGYKGAWDVITGPVFVFTLGGSEYTVPSGHHVVIGDDYGDIDFIIIDEVFNRPIELIQLDHHLMNWVVHKPVLVDYKEEVDVYWPMSKNIIPIQDQQRVILLSDRDLYSKFKNDQVEVFTSAH